MKYSTMPTLAIKESKQLDKIQSFSGIKFSQRAISDYQKPNFSHKYNFAME